MASILFSGETYRAAFAFDLEEDFDFVLVVFFDVLEEARLVLREDADDVDGLLREPFARERVRGASLTGSATRSVRPVVTELEEM